jgi:O-antigen ligase
LALAAFHVGLLLVFWSPLDPSFGTGLIAGALLLSVLLAPWEYALGALAFVFVAAHTARLEDWFLGLRWVFLGLALLSVTGRLLLRRRGGRPYPNRFEYLLLVFVAVTLATLSTSVAPRLSALKLGAMLVLLGVASRATALLADRYGPAAPRRLTVGLLSYLLGVLVLPGLVYWARLGSGVITDSGWFVGYFGNPNASGAMLGLCLPWLAAVLFRWRRLLGPARAALLPVVLLLTYLLLLSASRAAIVGTMAAVAAFTLIHANRRIAALVLLLAVLGSVRALADPEWLPRVSSKFLYKHERRRTANVLESRQKPWDRTIARFRQRPWLGLGFGVTSAAQASWTEGARTEGELETGSSFWGTLLQVGIIGAAPLFAALLLALAAAARFAWRVKDPWLTGLYGSVLSLVVGALLNGWLLSPGSSSSVYFWIQLFFLNAILCRFHPARGRPSA